MARSWFYLALWHGTPENLTEYLMSEVSSSDRVEAEVGSVDWASADTQQSESFVSDVASADRVQSDIESKLEVRVYGRS